MIKIDDHLPKDKAKSWGSGIVTLLDIGEMRIGNDWPRSNIKILFSDEIELGYKPTTIALIHIKKPRVLEIGHYLTDATNPVDIAAYVDSVHSESREYSPRTITRPTLAECVLSGDFVAYEHEFIGNKRIVHVVSARQMDEDYGRSRTAVAYLFPSDYQIMALNFAAEKAIEMSSSYLQSESFGQIRLEATPERIELLMNILKGKI